MFRKLRKSKAQSTAEYAILIALVIGAATAMQIYVKRGMQGRVKEVVDHTGTGGEVAGVELVLSGDQYEPYYSSSAAQSRSDTQDKTEVREGGSVIRSIEGEGDISRGARKTVTGWEEGVAVDKPALPD